MTFPGNIKGGINACSFSSSHIFRAGQTDPLFLTSAADPHQHEESTSNLWTVVL